MAVIVLVMPFFHCKHTFAIIQKCSSETKSVIEYRRTRVYAWNIWRLWFTSIAENDACVCAVRHTTYVEKRVVCCVLCMGKPHRSNEKTYSGNKQSTHAHHTTYHTVRVHQKQRQWPHTKEDEKRKKKCLNVHARWNYRILLCVWRMVCAMLLLLLLSVNNRNWPLFSTLVPSCRCEMPK